MQPSSYTFSLSLFASLCTVSLLVDSDRKGETKLLAATVSPRVSHLLLHILSFVVNVSNIFLFQFFYLQSFHSPEFYPTTHDLVPISLLVPFPVTLYLSVPIFLMLPLPVPLYLLTALCTADGVEGVVVGAHDQGVCIARHRKHARLPQTVVSCMAERLADYYDSMSHYVCLSVCMYKCFVVRFI